MGEGECITVICAGGGSERGRSCAASAVALHLDAVDAASRQAGSPLGRSLRCIKPTSHPFIGLALKPASPTSTGGLALLIPTQGAPPNRHEQAGYRSRPESALPVVTSRLRGDTWWGKASPLTSSIWVTRSSIASATRSTRAGFSVLYAVFQRRPMSAAGRETITSDFSKAADGRRGWCILWWWFGEASSCRLSSA